MSLALRADYEVPGESYARLRAPAWCVSVEGRLGAYHVVRDNRGRLWAAEVQVHDPHIIHGAGPGGPHAVTVLMPIYGPVGPGTHPNGNALHDDLCVLARAPRTATCP